jgi:hypothetical protein
METTYIRCTRGWSGKAEHIVRNNETSEICQCGNNHVAIETFTENKY